MKNILTLLALMTGTTVALNAQTIEVLQINTSIGVYTVATPNQNGNQVDFQLLMEDGNVWANCQYHNIQNRLTIDYVEGNCNVDAEGYTDATGEFNFKPDADAVDVLGMDLCYSLDDDTEPALYGDYVLFFYNQWVGQEFGIVVTDVVGDQVYFNMYYGEGEDTYWWNAIYHINSDMFTGEWIAYYFMTNQGGGEYFYYNDYTQGFNVTDDVIAYFQSLNELDACQAANADLQNVVSAQGAQLADLQAAIDSLEAINDNLVAENAELAADLYECQTDLDVTEGQLDACADNLQDWQLFTAGLQGDLLSVENELDACEAVNDSLLNELATLTIINEDCAYNYGELTDVLNDTLEFYNEVLIGAGTTINELNDEVDALQDALDYAVADGDTCFAEYSALDDQFTAAVFEYEDIIDSLNAIISAVPATIEAIVEPLNAQLEAAQECCSSCPAAIETAADNAYELGYGDAAEECNEVALDLLNETYWGGFADGESQGYQAGLEDCEGSVSGLTDIDGTTIAVIGYYNELGQVIDPRTATGVIIRRHEDGTFSKYIKALR